MSHVCSEVCVGVGVLGQTLGSLKSLRVIELLQVDSFTTEC